MKCKYCGEFYDSSLAHSHKCSPFERDELKRALDKASAPMTKPSEMPGWPEAPKIVDNGAWLEYRGIKYHLRDSMMAHFAYKDDLYQAAMARLRYWDECVRAILGRIAGVTVNTERDELFDKLTVAESDLQIVLEHIGPLPPLPPQQQRTEK